MAYSVDEKIELINRVREALALQSHRLIFGGAAHGAKITWAMELHYPPAQVAVGIVDSQPFDAMLIKYEIDSRPSDDEPGFDRTTLRLVQCYWREVGPHASIAVLFSARIRNLNAKA